MGKRKGFGRRVEKLRIDGKLHLVRIRWQNPAMTDTIHCAYCKNANMRAVLDIIQHGFYDDKMRTYFLCQECGHCTEYRYIVECANGQGADNV